ncbi:MAG: chemotaxis response regulator protein-glutamate methylesterase [Caulobacterales bacterium 68-7]|nr:MAG: chemotaxis response regulator protein-glutamate methylesterase [Caulobacterales bacterium 68-7]
MIKVLAVDDSALMRRLIAELFAEEDEFDVSFARNGVEALAMLHEQQPDVVTLDIHMPKMDGLACLDRIMVERPCPVVMFSSLTADGARETVEALSLGAVDFVPKPSGAISLKLDEFGPLLIDKVRAASKARLARTHRLAERVRLRSGVVAPPPKRVAAPRITRRRPVFNGEAGRVVLVGCSTGGPPALDALLEPLPADFPWPIVVAQHMPASFTGALASRLDRLCALSVAEVSRPTPLLPGCVYVGRGDADLILSRRGEDLVALSAPSSAAFRWHPSVDRLVDSALDHQSASALIGVLMTGMGNDGAAGMTRLKAAGGRTIAEAEETAVVWGMPGELVRAGGAEFVLPLDQIAEGLMDMAVAA